MADPLTLHPEEACVYRGDPQAVRSVQEQSEDVRALRKAVGNLQALHSIRTHVEELSLLCPDEDACFAVPGQGQDLGGRRFGREWDALELLPGQTAEQPSR